MTIHTYIHRVSAGCQCGRDTLNSVDRCCANVESAERELLQPRLRSGSLVFLAGGLALRPLPQLLFPSKYPPPFAQFQVFTTQVLAFVLRTCWVRHSHHALTSPSSTLLFIRLCPPSISPLLASGPTFSVAAVPQLCYRRHGCRGKRFYFVGVHHHQSMLLAGLHCQHQRVHTLIDVMKEHRFMRELYSLDAEYYSCCRLPSLCCARKTPKACVNTIIVS